MNVAWGVTSRIRAPRTPPSTPVKMSGSSRRFGLGRESLAVGHGARDGSGPDRGGVGGVGGDGRYANEDQRWKGDEAAASRDGIDRSRDDCGEKEEDWVRKVHAKEYQKSADSCPSARLSV